MKSKFPFTDAGIEAYRAWSDQAETHREALQLETEALCSEYGISFDDVFWSSMSGEDMQRHDYLLEVVRDANITPTKAAYFMVQKYGFELYELEKRLFANAIRQCKKRQRRMEDGVTVEIIRSAWQARKIRMSTQVAMSENNERGL